MAARLVLLFAMYVATHTTAHAVARTLADCKVTSAPTSAAPLDLDACTIDGGDEITGILTGLASTYGAVHIRAPSKSLSVWAAFTAFTVPTFSFVEDESPLNQLAINHIAVASSCTGAACDAYWTLWRFTNFVSVTIGGPNLSMTFNGNHPGFANCVAQQPYLVQVNGVNDAICDANRGLIESRITNQSSPTLFDLRANVRYAMHYGLYMTGSNPQYYELDSNGHTKTCNVAGSFYATSGIFFHDGACRDVWLDPDRTVIADPYLRGNGWQGQIATGTSGGRPVACSDNNNDQVRQSGGAAYYSSSITGGVTIRYGAAGWGQRLTQYVGAGVKSPFIVRLQDWGLTGPIEKACPFNPGCTVGARGRATTEINFFKGDPHNRPDTGTQVRFVRFMLMTPQYGNGWTNQAFAGCANSLNGQPGGSDDGQFARLENNSLGPTSSTRDWSIEFVGDWRTVAQGGTFTRGSPALVFSFYEDTGRSYRHGALGRWRRVRRYAQARRHGHRDRAGRLAGARSRHRLRHDDLHRKQDHQYEPFRRDHGRRQLRNDDDCECELHGRGAACHYDRHRIDGHGIGTVRAGRGDHHGKRDAHV
jgi:hypothetical protein